MLLSVLAQLLVYNSEHCHFLQVLSDNLISSARSVSGSRTPDAQAYRKFSGPGFQSPIKVTQG